MNVSSRAGLWWGYLLIGGGALWLANAAGVSLSPFVPAAFFAVGGAGFAFEFVRDARSWWAAVPTGALLGLAALIALLESTGAPGPFGAAILLAGTGLGFGAVALRTEGRSWAFIPAGLLLVVAAIVGAVPVVGRQEDIAVVVLVIIALAVGALAFVPLRGRRQPWLVVPAGVFAVVAWFLARGEARALEPYNWVSAAALLAVGLILVARTRSGSGAGRDER